MSLIAQHQVRQFPRPANAPSPAPHLAELRKLSGEDWPKLTPTGYVPLIALNRQKFNPQFNSLLRLRQPTLPPRFAGRMLLWWAGDNPTSTHKDFAAEAHVKAALGLYPGYTSPYKSITIASCGNAAEALAVAAAPFVKAGLLECALFVPRRYLSEKLKHRFTMVCGAKLVEIEGEDQGVYDRAVRASIKYAESKPGTVYDANSGSVHQGVEHEAYAEFTQIMLRHYYSAQHRAARPIAAIAVPFGNGPLLHGVSLGVERYCFPNHQQRKPALQGGTTATGNPILNSLRLGAHDILDLESTTTGDPAEAPLSTLNPSDGKLVLEALTNCGGWAWGADIGEMNAVKSLIVNSLAEHGYPQVDPLLAGTAGLQALIETFCFAALHHKKNTLSSRWHVRGADHRRTGLMARIRQATKDDLSSVSAVESACFGNKLAFNILAFRHFWDVAPDYFLIAAEKERVVGYIAAIPSIEAGEVLVVGIAVLPEHQAKGLGLHLWRALQTVLQGRGVYKVVTVTSPSNKTVLTAASLFGFTKIAEEPDYFGPGETRVIMRKRIQ